MSPFLTERPPHVYEPRTPNTEQQFEEQILRVARHIMPNYKAAEWKPIVRDHRDRGAQPDLAVISNDLEDWYVVEVELATHSVRGHIAPQLETLRNGIYDRSLLPSLGRAFPDLEEQELSRLMGRDPGLLCIVDHYTEPIARTCRTFGFELVVLEPYYGELAGWGVYFERLPYELIKTNAPSTYTLRRGPWLGNSVVMELPRNFPASFYKVRLPTESEDQPDQFAQVVNLDRGPSLVLPSSVVPEHARAVVRVIDPQRNLAELTVQTQ